MLEWLDTFRASEDGSHCKRTPSSYLIAKIVFTQGYQAPDVPGPLPSSPQLLDTAHMMLREDASDRSPTSSYTPPAMPVSNPALVDIFDEPAPAIPTTASSLDDIFDCSEPSSPNQTLAGLHQHVSDIPRLRSVHVTAGYRDGIADSKASHVQAGFDEGFPLGAVLGLRVGWVFGVLDNLSAALKTGAAEGGARGEQLSGLSANLDRLRSDAREELSIVKLFGEQYFDGEGTWRYDAGEEDRGITFREVASRHPLVKKWVDVVERQALALHADLDMLQRQGDAKDPLVLVG